MTYPFIQKYGREYQRALEPGFENKFTTVGDIVVVKPLLNSDKEFLVDLDTWNKLPWSGWTLRTPNGYVANGSLQIHRVVAYLNGLLEDDPNAVIDHNNRNRLDNI